MLHWVIPQFVIFAFSASHSIEMLFYCPKSMPSKIHFHIQFSKSMSRPSTVSSAPILSSATLYKIPITSRYPSYGGCMAGVRGGRRALVLQRCSILWSLWAHSRRKIRSHVALNLPNYKRRPISRLNKVRQKGRLEYYERLWALLESYRVKYRISHQETIGGLRWEQVRYMGSC